MKTQTLALVLLLAVRCVHAQGTVVFSNIGTGTAISNGVTFTVLPSGTQFKAGLYYLPDRGINYSNNPAAFGAAAFQLGASANSFILSGLFAAGTRTTPPAGDPWGTPGGGSAWFQVRAWLATFGGQTFATWEEAMATQNPSVFAGYSAILFMKTGDPENDIGPTSLVDDGGLMGWYVTPIPEPSVALLGVLAATTALLLSRRRM